MTQNKKRYLYDGLENDNKNEQNTTILICNICLNVSKEFIMHKIVIKRNTLKESKFSSFFLLTYNFI